MNVDLRNISTSREEKINVVKKRNGFKTNIKAVEHCIDYHNIMVEQLNDLTNKLRQANFEKDKALLKIAEIKECGKFLKDFLT